MDRTSKCVSHYIIINWCILSILLTNQAGVSKKYLSILYFIFWKKPYEDDLPANKSFDRLHMVLTDSNSIKVNRMVSGKKVQAKTFLMVLSQMSGNSAEEEGLEEVST